MLSELLALNANMDVLIAATIRNDDTFAYFLMVCGKFLVTAPTILQRNSNSIKI